MTLPLIDLAAQQARIRPALDAAIARVLAHGQYISGPEVAELEARLAALTGAAHCIACANGTDALVLALRALAASRGDAVLVPAFTFAATAGAVSLVGATPVFVDVRPDSFNIDPAGLAAGVDAARRLGLRPVGVVVVDLFGQPADYDAIEAGAAASGLWVVADAAQSLGAAYRGRKVGTLAQLTTTSFYPSKPLGCCGDGGAAFTDDPALAATLRSLREHGRGGQRYEHLRVGTNSRLDTLQAAILLAKLDIFADEVEARRRAARIFDGLLAGRVTTPAVIEGASPVWAHYTIRAPRRDLLANRLHEAGVATAIHYPRPLHLQPAFADCPVAEGGCPVSERLAGEVLSLPMHPYLDRPTQERIAAALRY